MSKPLRCLRGHEWLSPVEGDPRRPAPAPRAGCPVCGGTAVEESRAPAPVTATTQEALQVSSTPHAQGQSAGPGSRLAPPPPPAPGARAGQEGDASTPAAAPLPAVSGYEVLGELGRGGMGVVYRARHLRLNRLVALKLPRAAHFEPGQLDRLRAEAKAIAQLQHPHIVQIFEVGEHDGRPFLALELVAGGSLRRRLDGTPQPAPAAAEVVEVLARTMAYAHARGVIHRDLKPGNVLLSPDGWPKVSDFGLAKWFEAGDNQTLSGAVLGTPCYMAPEQAAGKVRDVGPAADVYALGVILYELLTGRPPFQGRTTLETLDQVRTLEPVPPRRLQPRVPRDLETICLECLRKEPSRRYRGARELADDLGRFRAGQPIAARPPGPGARLALWGRRNPAIAGLTAVVLALVAAVTAGAVLTAVGFGKVAERERGARAEAERATAEARQSAEEARRQVVRSYTTNGARLADEGDLLGSLLWFSEAGLLPQGEEPAAALRFRAAAFLRPCPRLVQFFFPDGQVVCSDFSRDGRQAVTADREQRVRVWDVASGAPVTGPLPHGAAVAVVRFSPDGRRVAGVGGGRVRVWDARTGAAVPAAVAPGRAVRDASFSPDGRWLLTLGEDGTAVRCAVGADHPAGKPFPHDGRVSHASFSADGRRVLTTGAGGTAVVWDAATGERLLPALQHPGPSDLTQGWFSPDGGRLVTVAADQAVTLWDAGTGRRLAPPLRHDSPVRQASFSPDGRRLLVASGETVRVWDAATGAPVTLPLPNDALVWHAVFSPDGRYVLAAAGDRAQLWDAETGKRAVPPLRHRDLVSLATFSPDGRRVLVAGESVRVWDLATHHPLRQVLKHDGEVRRAWFSPDGARVVTASLDGTARVWEAATSRPATPPLRHAGGVWQAYFSPDGARVLTTSLDGTARVWDAATGRPVTPPLRHDGYVYHGAFSPDGRTVATAGADGTARAWDARTGRPLFPPLVHGGTVHHVSFSPDGRRLVTACEDGAVQVWDAATGRRLVVTAGHAGRVNHASFSPDGRRLLTASDDRTARVWDAATGEPLGPPLPEDGAVETAAFSPDGGRVVTASTYQTARLWDAATGVPLTPPLKHGSGVRRVAFSPDGRAVVTAGDDRTARVWETATGLPLTPPLVHPAAVRCASFSPDGRRVVTACADGTAQVWDVADDPGRESVADLVLRARLLAAHQVDRTGGLVRLDRDPLRRAGEDLRGRFPEEFVAPPEDVRAWHCREARDRERLGRWQEVVDHLDPVLRAEPDRWAERRSRGNALAELGRWGEADADYAAVAGVGDPAVGFRRALLALLLGNAKAYREVCAELLRQAGTAGGADAVPWAVRAGLLAPAVDTDVPLLLRLAEADPTQAGAALYRAGRPDAAVKRFGEVLKADGKTGTPRDWLFAALAAQQLGRDAEARRWLRKATDALERRPRSGEAAPVPPLPWEERAELQLLRREAEARCGDSTARDAP